MNFSLSRLIRFSASRTHTNTHRVITHSSRCTHCCWTKDATGPALAASHSLRGDRETHSTRPKHGRHVVIITCSRPHTNTNTLNACDLLCTTGHSIATARARTTLFTTRIPVLSSSQHTPILMNGHADEKKYAPVHSLCGDD